jgi:aquaporin Z
MGANMKELLSEFIGTYLLVLTVGCNVLGGSGVMAGLSIASVLMVSIYALGSVSGANFNPAVSLCLLLSGSLDGAKAGMYMVTQLAAGGIAGATYTWMHGKSFNLSPVGDFSWASAATCEVLYTFMLCFVVLRAAVSKMNPASQEYFGLAIGFVIVAAAYGAGSISMGCFNPAVAFGIDISSVGQGFHWCIWYSMFEFLGAALAVGANALVEDSGAASKGVKNFVSEFLGTFFLVLTVGLNVLTMSPAGALSIGASLMCMIYALGGVSGAHFNPAVTTALTFCGKSPVGDLPLYVTAQLLGGLCAGLAYTNIVGLAFPLAPGKGYSWGDAAFAETAYTFVLCFVVLNVATLAKKAPMSGGGKSTQIYGFAIGSCIIVGGNAIGKISGGSLNPAVSFGIDASYAAKGGSFSNCLAYTAFELIGATIAAMAFTVVRDEEKGETPKPAPRPAAPAARAQ